MRDRIRILAGLVAFIALATAPFWTMRLPAHRVSLEPQLLLPAQEKQCVAPTSFMRSSHMQLLVSWREDVVRRNDRRYVAFTGKTYEKSLTRTCLGCHDKQEFCDRCHAYAGVSQPNCWNCHNQPAQPNLARSLP